MPVSLNIALARKTRPVKIKIGAVKEKSKIAKKWNVEENLGQMSVGQMS